MASGGAGKEDGLARKTLAQLKFIADDVYSVLQYIWEYKEKKEFAILVGIALAVVFFLKYLCQAGGNATKNRAHRQNVISHVGGNHVYKNVDMIASGSPGGHGLALEQNIIETSGGASSTHDDVKIIATMQPSFQSLGDRVSNKYYPMATSGREGICLILNYFQYVDEEGKSSNRYGTMKDAADLESLFRKLNYDVKRFDDLSLADTKSKLSEVPAIYEQNPSYCSFILCILAHGKPGYFLCNQEGHSYEDLFNYFKTGAIAGKPKLIFIQACQGDTVDGGVGQEAQAPSTNTLHSTSAGSSNFVDSPFNSSSLLLQPDSAAQASVLNASKASKSAIDGANAAAAAPTQTFTSMMGLLNIIPTGAHLFLLVSSFAGTASVRIPAEGTWFIQDLVAVFSQGAPGGTPLNELADEVKERVGERIHGRVELASGRIRQIIKQVPVAGSTLSREFKFAARYKLGLLADDVLQLLKLRW